MANFPEENVHFASKIANIVQKMPNSAQKWQITIKNVKFTLRIDHSAKKFANFI